MYITIIICALVLLLAAVILTVPVKAAVLLKKNSSTALFKYKVTIAGITVFSNDKKTKKMPKAKEATTGNTSKKKIKASDVINIYNEFSDKITELIEYASNNALSFLKTDIYLCYGTGDAAATGITYGVISGIIYSLVGIIDSRCTIKSKYIQISPDFFNSVFETECECIVKLRNVHIIVIAVKLLLLMLKIRKWSPGNIIEENNSLAKEGKECD